MNKNVNQGDHRQLLQPQQWTGYENPQLDESLLQSSPPPAYASIPSAPPVSHPQHYDQVPGDVQSSQLLQHPPPPQYQPQPYQPQLYQPPHYQMPNVHSSPVAVNTTVNVNVEGMVTPSNAPAGCCGMGNQNSAIAITIVILVMSFFSALTFFQFMRYGFQHEFSPELWLQIVFILPTAILFPASIMALDGIFKDKPSSLFFMISALTFYFWLNFIGACIMLCVIFVMIFSFFGILYAPQFLILLITELFFMLAYLSIEKKVKKVLTDFHIVMLRRNMANRH